MTSLTVGGALCGVLFAAGMLAVWARVPMRREPGLADRLAPYLRDTAPPSRLLNPVAAAQKPLAAALAPVVARLGEGINSVLGGAVSVARRQARAGESVDVSAFRAEQVAWGAAGACGGVIVATLTWSDQRGAVVVPVLVVALGAALGIFACDQELTRRVRRREERMVAEFPTIAELLALSVSAGEGTSSALNRVCRLSSGELSRELHTCLADARAGASLPAALQGLAARTGLPALARFVDGIVIALERGTPLAAVLRAQAQDVREEGRRQVMEAAGRKEIQMMVPVVFLVLPVTILFAIFPGMTYLNITP